VFYVCLVLTNKHTIRVLSTKIHNISIKYCALYIARLRAYFLLCRLIYMFSFRNNSSQVRNSAALIECEV